MRPIKFRAWDKQQKKMIVVPSLSFGDDGEALTIMIWHKTAEMYDRALVVGESAELMQFTGLLDANGKEIYEGDIVDDPHDMRKEYRGVITFDKVNLGCNGGEYNYVVNGFYAQTPSDEEREFTTDELNRGELAVIGNIYEHSDLLPKMDE